MNNINSSMIKPYYNIIDIRSKEKYLNGHIYNAINIEEDELLRHMDKYLDKTKIYYIYCSRGYRSKKCCELLRAFGYNVVNIIGGYESFSQK